MLELPGKISNLNPIENLNMRHFAKKRGIMGDQEDFWPTHKITYGAWTKMKVLFKEANTMEISFEVPGFCRISEGEAMIRMAK